MWRPQGSAARRATRIHRHSLRWRATAILLVAGCALPALLEALPDAAAEHRWHHSAARGLATPPRAPRIYVYDLPEDLIMVRDAGLAMRMAERIKEAYGTDNGDEADYYWIPGTGHYPNGHEVLLRLFDHIRQNYPWWNRTRDAGQARHIIMFLSDHGPGAAAFNRPLRMDSGVPEDINPASPTRNVIFLGWNGLRDGPPFTTECSTCQQIGKDIMIPTAENICGPLCGYNMTTLRSKAIWRLGEQDLTRELMRKRKYRLFYAGTIHNPKPDDFTGRGGIYHHYVNRTDYLIARNGEHERVKFADAMRDSDFCYSPMGQHGGDADRYVASIMFGCIPVMLNSSHTSMAIPHALPLEEALHWERFATITNTWDLERLDEQLQCLQPYVPMMRLAMREVWQRLLYSSTYNKSYLGEDKTHDVMHTIAQILGARLAHDFKPSRAAMERMAHHAYRFPCTNRPAKLLVPSLQAVAAEVARES